MPRFRTDIVMLHVPTSDLQRFGEDFDTFGEAISIPYELLRWLENEPGVQALQSNSWADLNGLRDHDGVEAIFDCYFQFGMAEEQIQGTALVTALHNRDELGGE